MQSSWTPNTYIRRCFLTERVGAAGNCYFSTQEVPISNTGRYNSHPELFPGFSRSL